MSWKSNSLNLAGRTVLVNSMITALPSYVMKTTHLLLSICYETEEITWNFLWGVNSIGRNKLHKVAWNNVCYEKSRVGLGIRHLREGNKDFMLKNAWGLISDKDSLWAKAIRSKYKCGSGTIPNIVVHHNASNFWRGIVNVKNHLHEGLIWHVNNRDKVRFWRDRWIWGIDCLEYYLNVSLSSEERDAKIVVFVQEDGSWDLQ